MLFRSVKIVGPHGNLMTWPAYLCKISEVQQLFTAYNKLLGFPMLIMIVEDSINSVFLIYNTLTVQAGVLNCLRIIQDLSMISGAILSLYLTARVGHRIKDAVGLLPHQNMK